MFAIIEPVTVFPGTATVLFINNVTVQPGQEATLQAWLQSADRANLTQTGVVLTSDAYAAWGTDDDYLYTYTATALGLTIVEIVPDAPAIIAPPLPDMSVPPMADEPAPVVG